MSLYNFFKPVKMEKSKNQPIKFVTKTNRIKE